jgi:hypothetical protein
VKPRIFIGSSTASAAYARAMHTQLANHAECTVWTEGAFNLASNTVQELHRNLRDSDFGIFVFAPDDAAQIQGDLLKITRDNVVYEAGLFSGFLAPERCFIAAPQSIKVRIPTDLLGMTLGSYEDQRTDSNHQSAVSSFCAQVEQRLSALGLFSGLADDELRELATKFECCDWIPDSSNPADPSDKRVAKKREVVAELDNFFRNHSDFNKHRLVHRHRAGYYVAMLRAIKTLPQAGDHEVIMKIQLGRFPHGFNYYCIMDAAEALRAANKLDVTQKASLKNWLATLPALDPGLQPRFNSF